MGRIEIAGLPCLVDDEDLPTIVKYHWSPLRTKYTVYASGRVGGQKVLMHRMLLDAPAGLEVDHKNGNGLDNQRTNLRLATPQQNRWNRQNSPSGKSSAYLGVYWNKGRGVWQAQAKGETSRYLGRFSSEEDAARAYDYFVLLRRGPYGRTNFNYSPGWVPGPEDQAALSARRRRSFEKTTHERMSMSAAIELFKEGLEGGAYKDFSAAKRALAGMSLSEEERKEAVQLAMSEFNITESPPEPKKTRAAKKAPVDSVKNTLEDAAEAAHEAVVAAKKLPPAERRQVVAEGTRVFQLAMERLGKAPVGLAAVRRV